MRRLLPLLLLFACDDPGQGGAITYSEAGPSDAAATDLAPLLDLAPLPDMLPGCALADLDEDGYGTDPSCEFIDCDDANRSIHPSGFEACNGLDDDCDGATDEGLNVAVCGQGLCRREVPNCVDGAVQRCTPGEPAAETCNGEDDDCDGTVDEGVMASACGVGACARQGGCVDGAPGECTPGEPAPEACNAIDDDCDGSVDEGVGGREVVETSYSALVQHHENCGSNPERIGPNCNAAMNRFCAARDCVNTGFGPLENSGDISIVACLATLPASRVTFADLAAHHPPCNGQQERIGPHCNAAIHRWCRAQGHISGFGPLESGPDFVFVACLVEHAEVVQVTYPTLATHHPPCDGNGQRIGPDCNAAINRHCSSRGFLTGYGPVENFGQDATIVCIRR